MIEKAISKGDITRIKMSRMPLPSLIFYLQMIYWYSVKQVQVASQTCEPSLITSQKSLGNLLTTQSHDSFAPLKSTQQLLDLSLECLECQSYRKVFLILDSLFIGGENQLNGSRQSIKRLKKISKAGIKLKLSYARSILTQSVFNVMTNYLMSRCKMPKKMIKTSNLQQAKFGAAS